MRVDVSNLTAFVLSFKHDDKVPHGISCRFLKLNEDWGIKVYRCGCECNNAFQKQNFVHAFGLAPRVGIQFQTEHYFCYTTEAVETLDAGFEHEHYYIKDRMILEKYPNINHLIREASKESRLHGHTMEDNHFGNWGFLRGKLVRIDFGY